MWILIHTQNANYTRTFSGLVVCVYLLCLLLKLTMGACVRVSDCYRCAMPSTPIRINHIEEI